MILQLSNNLNGLKHIQKVYHIILSILNLDFKAKIWLAKFCRNKKIKIVKSFDAKKFFELTNLSFKLFTSVNSRIIFSLKTIFRKTIFRHLAFLRRFSIIYHLKSFNLRQTKNFHFHFRRLFFSRFFWKVFERDKSWNKFLKFSKEWFLVYHMVSSFNSTVFNLKLVSKCLFIIVIWVKTWFTTIFYLIKTISVWIRSFEIVMISIQFKFKFESYLIRLKLASISFRMKLISQMTPTATEETWN